MIYALSITGPTASGKTALSIDLARELGAEIISSDSMQIYRYMDIGTAKATPSERAEIKHHLIDFLDPEEQYSAEAYRADAIAAAEQITERGVLPLFVGGTGLYVDALMRGGMDSTPESKPEYREKILAGIKTESDIDSLWQRLYEVDPESAEKIHKNNVRRVIRALEIYDATGKPKSYFDSLSRSKAPDIRIGMITLDFHNRDNLYSRVDKRVDLMIEEGLVDEVKSLYEKGLLKKEYTSAQAIGYKEMISYVRGEATLFETSELIKQSSRRYAKRQLTWFRHVSDAVRVFIDTPDGVMRPYGEVLSEIKNAAGGLLEEIRKNESN